MFRVKSLDRLKQAVQGGHRDPVSLDHEPDFAPLRTTEEFKTLVEQERKGAERAAAAEATSSEFMAT